MITIKIFGRSYSFKTELDAEKANAVADILIYEVGRIQEKTPEQTPEMAKLTILLLAALNMASENFDLKQNQNNFIRRVHEKSAHLNRLMDEPLGKWLELKEMDTK